MGHIFKMETFEENVGFMVLTVALLKSLSYFNITAGIKNRRHFV